MACLKYKDQENKKTATKKRMEHPNIYEINGILSMKQGIMA